MVNLANDIEILTTLSETTIDKLNHITEMIIGHAVYETQQVGESITEIDLGYGTLAVCTSNDQVKYRFIPSMALERTVLKVVEQNTSPIKQAADNQLKIKLKDTYKELI